jgi:hypothetical protein
MTRKRVGVRPGCNERKVRRKPMRSAVRENLSRTAVDLFRRSTCRFPIAMSKSVGDEKDTLTKLFTAPARSRVGGASAGSGG